MYELCITQKTKTPNKTNTLFYCKGHQYCNGSPREVVVSVFRDTRNPMRHGFEQPTQHDEQWSWTRWSPELSPQWFYDSI